MTASTIAGRLAAVRARIAAAAERSGRSLQDVLLVVVSKGVPPDRVTEAVVAGVADIGENRARELRAKQETLADQPIRWHFVGSLQRNKVDDVVGRVVLVHSVDSVRLAEAIGARAVRAGVRQDVLLQVNTSGERTKHGMAAGEALDAATEVARMRGIRLRGFMTIPSPGDLVAARRSFRDLAVVRDRIAAAVPDATELSMGMSEDLDVAVEEGATIVRIGTAIFGSRSQQAPDGESGSHRGRQSPR